MFLTRRFCPRTSPKAGHLSGRTMFTPPRIVQKRRRLSSGPQTRIGWRRCNSAVAAPLRRTATKCGGISRTLAPRETA
ncbi:hypothetical protein BDW72DRAFT_188300 [Aspergillus terricola var. indicus]